jgi:hypothetical protein
MIESRVATGYFEFSDREAIVDKYASLCPFAILRLVPIYGDYLRLLGLGQYCGDLCCE